MSDPGSEEVNVPATVREVVGVFHDRDSFQAAIEELRTNGFDRAELSLLASERAVEGKLGHLYEKIGELEDNPNVPRTAYVGKDSVIEAKTGIIGGLAYVGALAAVGAIVASGGTVAAAILGAVAAGGVGGGIGTFAARFLGRDRAQSIEQQLGKGGLLLWVSARDEAHEKRAMAILTKHSAEDVHVHDLPAPTQPQADPLSGVQPDPFLPNAKV